MDKSKINKIILKRLDKYLVENYPLFSRSKIQSLIKNKKILVNNKEAKPNMILKKGDKIKIDFKKENQKLKPKKEKLEIVYKDKNIVLIEKPAGIIVHPTKYQRDNTLVNVLLSEFPEIRKLDKERPGLVHRLDQETSGLLVVARNKKAYDFLKEEIRSRRFFKKYYALVSGKLNNSKGKIEAPIKRGSSGKKMAISFPGEGKDSETSYKVLKYFPKADASFLEVTPKTGRTHQIRVHLASIGHPIWGDKLYASRKIRKIIPRHFLHAYFLKFKLPSGKIIEFKSKLPEDLNKLLKKLENQ